VVLLLTLTDEIVDPLLCVGWVSARFGNWPVPYPR
jgi:hypothetical protein